MPGARSTIARAARELLELYDNEPDLFNKVMKLLTPRDIDILREVATWDDYLRRPARFTCPRCGAVSHNPHDAENRYCARCHVFVDE